MDCTPRPRKYEEENKHVEEIGSIARPELLKQRDKQVQQLQQQIRSLKSQVHSNSIEKTTSQRLQKALQDIIDKQTKELKQANDLREDLTIKSNKQSYELNAVKLEQGKKTEAF